MTRDDVIVAVTSHTLISYDYTKLKQTVDKIYDDFEKEISHRDKTIKLLNEEMLKLRKEIEELKR